MSNLLCSNLPTSKMITLTNTPPPVQRGCEAYNPWVHKYQEGRRCSANSGYWLWFICFAASMSRFAWVWGISQDERHLVLTLGQFWESGVSHPVVGKLSWEFQRPLPLKCLLFRVEKANTGNLSPPSHGWLCQYSYLPSWMSSSAFPARHICQCWSVVARGSKMYLIP